MRKYFMFILFFYISINYSFAHPGNVDIYGGHTCYTNCSSYGLYEGQYHFHLYDGYSYDTSRFISVSSYCPSDFDIKEYDEKTNELTRLDNSLITLQKDIERTNAGQLNNATIRAMTVDTRRDILLEKSLLLTEVNILKSQKYACDKKEAEEEYFRLIEINSYIDKGEKFIDNGFLKEGIDEYKKVLSFNLTSEQRNSVYDLIGYLHYKIGLIEGENGNKFESIRNLEQTLEYSKNKLILYLSYIQIALNYNKLEDYQNSIYFYKKARTHLLNNRTMEVYSSIEVEKLDNLIKNGNTMIDSIEKKNSIEIQTPTLSLKERHKIDFQTKLGNTLSKISESRLLKLQIQISELLKSRKLDDNIRAKLEALTEIIDETLQK